MPDKRSGCSGCALAVAMALALFFIVIRTSTVMSQVKSSSVSPNGRNRVVLLQDRLLQMQGGLYIEYVIGNKTIYEKHIGGDVYLNFVEYAWSQDSALVGLFMGNMQSGHAFDFATGKEIPFDMMKGLVAEKIRKHYGLTKSDDPFDCRKCTSRFIKEHPSSVTY